MNVTILFNAILVIENYVNNVENHCLDTIVPTIGVEISDDNCP